MGIEQLRIEQLRIEQLNALKILLNRFKKNELEICVRDPNGFVHYNYSLYNIMKKYEVNIIEDLKQERSKRETELESLSILQLNKLV